MLGGLVIFGVLSDRYLKKIVRSGKQIRPEDRLPFTAPSAIAAPVGLLIYGWSAQYHVFCAYDVSAKSAHSLLIIFTGFVPIFGTAFIGLSSIAATVSHPIKVL